MAFTLPKEYLGHILATFIGGFVAAHLLLRLSKEPRTSASQGKETGRRKILKQESVQTESSASAPPTPAGSDCKSHVTFQDDKLSLPVSETCGSCLTPKPSAFSTAAAQKHTPLALGVLPSLENSQLSSTDSVGSGPHEVSDASLARAPSGIPTDIHLPELVFGEQIPNARSCQRPEVLPFSTYAPCRLLDVKPDSPENGHIFEGIRTIAAYYLRADSCSICECIQTFELNDLLFSIARLECAFKKTLLGGRRNWSFAYGNGAEDTEAIIARAAERAVEQNGHVGPKGAEEMEAVRGVVAALMHELECILHEYLSFNWDRVEEIYEANKHLLREEGLVCAWKSSASLASLPSTPSIAGMSPRTYEHESSISRSLSNLTDADQPSSPGSDRSLHSTIETFDEYMANKNSLSSSLENMRRHLDTRRQSEPESEGEQRAWRQETEATALEDEAAARQTFSAMAGTSSKCKGGGKRKNSPEAQMMRKNHQASRRALRNWRRAKAAVTRKVTKDMLGPQRTFMSLKQMFEDLNRASEQPVLSQRQPIILLLGGGMAAGKSTVREIIGHDGFWSKVGKDAVVVEADAIKNRDVLYRSLTRLDMLDRDDDLRQHLHEYSTKAAEALLVAAVNQQKDVVFDGTMTWAPFVQQTIAMVRDHRHNYKRGPGFFVDDEGSTFERYWVIDDSSPIDVSMKKPYRIELVGVTCDTGLAVARGIWRKIRTGRSVPVPSQLRSHRLFAENFETFAGLVDSATLYHTGSALTTFNKGGVDLSPKMIAHRSSYTRGELLINPSAYKSFKQKMHIIDKATCRHDLYEGSEPCDGKVPTTQEDQMSTLRHVFRAADRRERKTLKKRPIPRSNSFW